MSSFNSVNSTADSFASSSTLFSKSTFSSPFVSCKPKSVEDVRYAMNEMDRINKTTFSQWIRSEKNLLYLCSYKGDLIQEYLDQDAQSAMHALEWIIEEWSVESVAELTLKLFYAQRINSENFAKRLYGLVHSWSAEKLVELLPILLIGESAEVCCDFFANFYLVSGYSTVKMIELVLPIAHGFKWNAEQLKSFLLQTIIHVVSDSATHRSMIMVVHDEIDVTLNKILLGVNAEILTTFEILYHVILEEKERFVTGSLEKSLLKTKNQQQQENFFNLDIPFMFDREE